MCKIRPRNILGVRVVKNGIVVTLLSLSLMACGGESNKDNNPGFWEFSSGIKGIEEQPSLTSADVSEGDSLTLNTVYSGNVEQNSDVSFNFTLDQDTQVALVLSSEAKNLDLSVSGNDLSLDSSLLDSNELIIFDALAGENYSVTVDTFLSSGPFQLKFVEANRASAGLSADEYLVYFTYTITETCSENAGAEEELVSNGSNFNVINWKSEYYANRDGTDKQIFDSVEGNTFNLYFNNKTTHDDGYYTNESTVIFHTDFNTGEVVGSANGIFKDVDETYTRDCRFNTFMTGQVIL